MRDAQTHCERRRNFETSDSERFTAGNETSARSHRTRKRHEAGCAIGDEREIELRNGLLFGDLHWFYALMGARRDGKTPFARHGAGSVSSAFGTRNGGAQRTCALDQRLYAAWSYVWSPYSRSAARVVLLPPASRWSGATTGAGGALRPVLPERPMPSTAGESLRPGARGSWSTVVDRGRRARAGAEFTAAAADDKN
jgi:hypothetical protein